MMKQLDIIDLRETYFQKELRATVFMVLYSVNNVNGLSIKKVKQNSILNISVNLSVFEQRSVAYALG